MTLNTYRKPRDSSVYSSMSMDGPAKTPATPAAGVAGNAVPAGPRVLTGTDVAALKPRHVVNTHLGLEFYVPDAWQETKNASSVHMHDAASGATLQAHGLIRPGATLEQWAGMRLPVVTKERPYLEQVVKPQAFKAAEWESHTQGVIVEYRGRAPGDDDDTCVMICCARSDDMLISIVVTARAAVYEQQRAVYQWIMSRMEIGNPHTMARLATENGKPVNYGQHRAASSVEGRTYSIGKLASGQYLLNVGFMLYLITCLIVAYVETNAQGVDIRELPQRVPLGLLLLTFVLLVTAGVMGLYGMIRISFSGAWSRAYNIFNVVTSFIPIANIISLFIANRRVISLLRSEGYTVGWLGSREAIPDNNHDMRNALILSFLLCAVPVGYPLLKTSLAKKMPEAQLATFTPPDQRFTIIMPGEPVEVPFKGPKIASNPHAYERVSGTVKYAVAYFDLPIRPANVSDSMDNIRDGFASVKRWKLEEESKIRVDGNAGRSLRVILADGQTQYVNYFIAGKSLYMVTAATNETVKDAAKITAYLESFHLN